MVTRHTVKCLRANTYYNWQTFLPLLQTQYESQNSSQVIKPAKRSWIALLCWRTHIITAFWTIDWSQDNPPSSLMASMFPCFMKRMAVSMACCGDVSYEPNGKSAILNALRLPLETAWQWSSISSTVTGRVVSCPCTTIPAESPTRSMSIPAESTCITKTL